MTCACDGWLTILQVVFTHSVSPAARLIASVHCVVAVCPTCVAFCSCWSFAYGCMLPPRVMKDSIGCVGGCTSYVYCEQVLCSGLRMPMRGSVTV
mgnify:CR=1 FL=1